MTFGLLRANARPTRPQLPYAGRPPPSRRFHVFPASIVFQSALPGPPHQNWGVVDSCQCMATIQDNPVFSPGRNTEIIGCPLPLVATKPGEQNGNTMFWMWYTITNPMRPIVFLQSMPDVTIGTGLSLADYVHWQPKDVSDVIFTTPVAGSCPPPPASAPVAPAPCMGCHNRSTHN